MTSNDHQITSCAIAMMLLVGTHNGSMTQLTTGVTVLSATAIGSILPDIDQPRSKISQFIKVPFYKLLNHRGTTHSLIGLIGFAIGLFMLGNMVFGFDQLAQPTTHIMFCVWLGLVLGYALHLLEDSWSQAGIRWLAPFTGFDKWSYYHYNTFLRKPVRWVKRSSKNIPVRHWWGRGYKVGGRMEKVITVMFLIPGMATYLYWIWQVI